MIISLNRLEDNLSDECIPNEVLLYTVYTCGKKTNLTEVIKKREKVIKFIKNYKQHIVIEKNIIKKNHLELIVNYLTSEKKGWDEKKLLTSFSHMCSWNKNKEIKNIEDIKIGKKTNSDPLTYDIIMIYQLCKKKNINISVNDTIEIMFSKLLQHEKPVSPVFIEKPVSPVFIEKPVSPDPDLTVFDREKSLEYITENIHGCSNKMLYKIKEHIPLFTNYDFKNNIDLDIQEIVEKININYMIMKSFLTPIEAIIFGAKFFFIDLTKSTNPIAELKKFNLCKHNNEKYKPVMEDEFSKIYNKNNFSIYLDKFWKPNISELYSNKILQQLNIFENTDGSQKIDTRYKMYNFYPGDIKEGENTITFGIIGTDSIKTFTPPELSELFSSDSDFINPLERNICIPLCVIGKLINICKEFPENDKFTYLTEVINKIKSEQKIKDSSIDDIIEKYIFSSEKINKFIKKIFLLGLKSRGWKETEIYITSFTDIVGENINLESITKEAGYIIESISNWQDVSVRVILKRLPIITYSNSRKCGRYYRTVFLEKIYTLYDLLNYITTIDTEKKIIPVSYILMATANFYKHEVSNENIIDITNFS